MDKKIASTIDEILPPIKLLVFEEKDAEGNVISPTFRYVMHPFAYLCDCEPCKHNEKELGIKPNVLGGHYLVMN